MAAAGENPTTPHAAGREGAATPGTLPEGLRVYAVGDIHGRRDLLDDLLGRIAADQAQAPADRPVAVFLGDYIDRGTDSAGVLDRLCADPLPGMETRFLMGNHEDFLKGFLAGDDRQWLAWLENGGVETLESYGQDLSGWPFRAPNPAETRERLAAAMPGRHRKFIADLELHCRYGGYLFVHAGIRPGIALENQDPHDMIWIRREFLNSAHDHGAVVVHGHTPVAAAENLDNRVNVDTGAFASGILTCAVLEGHKRRFLNT